MTGLPVDYDTVQVRGQYVYYDGTTVQGTVTFTPKVTSTSPATDTIIVLAPVTATLDKDGKFSIPLPATDDPDISPGGGWTYHVVEKWTRGLGRTFELPVPIAAAGVGIDLSDYAVGTPPVSPDPTMWATAAAVAAMQDQLLDQTVLANQVAAAQDSAEAAEASADLAVSTVGNKVDRNTQVFDVHDFGAVGDGVADDTSAINAAITAATAGAKVLLRPGGTYLQTGPILIAKPLILSGYGASVTTATLNLIQIQVSSGNVRLEGFELVGPGGGASVYDAAAGGIHIVGPESLATTPNFANTIDHIKCVDLHIRDLRRVGIYAEYARDVVVDRCVIERGVFALISFGSVDGGQITGCRLDTVYMTSLPNAYLIHLTRNKAKPIGSFPVTANIRVDGNYCAHNPLWEGIDTHAGRNLTITNNIVTDTYQPIAVVACPDSADAGAPNVYAPQNVSVIGNYCESTVTDGTRRPGIIVQGAGTGNGTFTELADGCRVIGNTVVGHGTQGTSTSGGIQLYYTRGCVVTDNVVRECSPAGVLLWHDNYAAMVSGNVITDTWTNSLTIACPIWVNDEYNTATIIGNRIERSTKSAGHVNDRAIYIAKNTATVKQNIGPNDMRGATLPVVDSSASSESSLIGNTITIGAGNNSAYKLGFYGTAPVIQPTVPTSGATLDQVITALANLGLIRRV